jgi:exonuclease SbcD
LPVTSSGENAVKALYRGVIEAANTVRGKLPLIVTGHLHITGGAVSELSERRIVVGGQEAISTDIFTSSVAYAALGHLHKPQSVSGPTSVRYAGSPFPMSVTEKDYEHSIVILDIDEAGGMKINLLRTPRPVAFYRVPLTGAAPLKAVEDELRRLEIEDPGEDRRPFLEIAVQLTSAEPELRRRIEGALEGKPVRLTRIVRQTAGEKGTLADSFAKTVMLNELEPADIFARRHSDEYGTEPPDGLKKAFEEVLAGVLSPSDEPARTT